MMKKSFAVIGANFGDEGKGLITDYLTRQHTTAMGDFYATPPIVARCNGGAQAGHTVVTDNERHVFGHVSSGTFAGAHTYLSKNFIINPYVLIKEREQLQWNTRYRQKIFAHPDCRVTTIYDMALNAIREIIRGNNRHGSCGLGINETVTRDLAGYPLRLRDFDGGANLDLIQKIYGEWWKPQYLELMKDPASQQLSNQLNAHLYQNIMLQQIASGAEFDVLETLSNPFDNYWSGELFHREHFGFPEQMMIIEGAQGLMLDEFLGTFPHVTRSVTGLASSVVAAAELGYTEITPYYVSRSYLTRHGAGQLDGEGLQITNGEIPTDSTNVTGQWQGHFRYAPLNLDTLRKFIYKDLLRGFHVAQVHGIKVNEPEIAITCMDHINDYVNVLSDDAVICQIPKDDFLTRVTHAVGYKVSLFSTGPTAKDVQRL